MDLVTCGDVESNPGPPFAQSEVSISLIYKISAVGGVFHSDEFTLTHILKHSETAHAPGWNIFTMKAHFLAKRQKIF